MKHATKENCKLCNEDSEDREYSDEEVCKECKEEAFENQRDKEGGWRLF